MKKWSMILLKMKYVKNETKIAKSLTQFFPRPLIFKLQQSEAVLKLSDICLELKLTKN